MVLLLFLSLVSYVYFAYVHEFVSNSLMVQFYCVFISQIIGEFYESFKTSEICKKSMLEWKIIWLI